MDERKMRLSESVLLTIVALPGTGDIPTLHFLVGNTLSARLLLLVLARPTASSGGLVDLGGSARSPKPVQRCPRIRLDLQVLVEWPGTAQFSRVLLCDGEDLYRATHLFVLVLTMRILPLLESLLWSAADLVAEVVLSLSCAWFQDRSIPSSHAYCW